MVGGGFKKRKENQKKDREQRIEFFFCRRPLGTQLSVYKSVHRAQRDECEGFKHASFYVGILEKGVHV